MRKLVLAVLALGIAGALYAAQVNPTSNVLGDTAGTAGTLVLRDSNGVVDADNLIQDATIATAKYENASITTQKLNFLDIAALTSGKVVCIPPGNNRKLGVCSNSPISGTCTCE